MDTGKSHIDLVERLESHGVRPTAAAVATVAVPTEVIPASAVFEIVSAFTAFEVARHLRRTHGFARRRYHVRPDVVVLFAQEPKIRQSRRRKLG